ncbi:MAG: hypothetical protein DHS20C17_28530 [Cyclobacteriaceae bacterium]|nr:MAG: hypothetical protein DHS20C17_28530 [Cyclobacteriaceae bacterium]
MKTRRNFIKITTAGVGATLVSPHLSALPKILAASDIACQQYPWFTFFRREGKDWNKDLAYSMNEFSKAGFTGFEPTFESVQDVENLEPLLRQHKLATQSLYVNSVLHDAERTEDSIGQVLEIAEAAKPLGIEILVTNPSPISWGGPEDKTDAQLITQAKALNHLGKKLRSMGITLAYHNHDAEMRNSAREFHHMMLATEPENVRLCLDAHWIYRGSGDSQVALFDIVDLYVDRVVELHLRQSKDGIWTEAFSEGDIDYSRLADILKSRGIQPHIVLEQAIEEASSNTLDAVKAHQLSLEYATEVFG